MSYSGGGGDTLLLAITLDEAVAHKDDILADLQAARTGGPLSNFFQFSVSGFGDYQLTLALDSANPAVGQFEDIILGTQNHDTALNGTTQNDLIIGLGGDDVIYAGGGDDVIVGGYHLTNNGYDRLYGEDGDDVFLFLATDNLAYDFIDGGAGNDTVMAVGGATIALTNHYDTIETFVGTGGTVIKGSPSVHSTLDFTNSEFVGIKEVEGGGSTANNVIFISTKSDATYRASGNNETFKLQGGKNATFVYSGTGHGFDSFVDIGYAGTAIAQAEAAGTVIGIGNYANQLDAIQGTGDTVVQASNGVHNVLNFATTTLTGVAGVQSGGGDDAVTTALNARVPSLTYDGGAYSGDKLYLAVTLEEAIANAAAIKADFENAKANPGGATLSSFFAFAIQNFESVRLAVYHNGELLGLIDNMILGTSNHDSGPPYAAALNGTSKNDLIIGLGGDDVIHGNAGNDIIVGGGSATNGGNDKLYGDAGDDVFVFLPTDNGYYDSIDGGLGNDTVIAVGGAVIGLTNHYDTIETFVGTGGTVIKGSPSVHSTLDFTNSAFVGIKEVEGGGSTANNVIFISTKSDATYRASGNNETFKLQGGKNATFVYSGTGHGFDSFVDIGYAGTAIARAETNGTTIGIGNYANQLDAIQGTGDTIIRASDGVHNVLNFSDTMLTGIAVVDSGGGDDVITVSNLSAASYRGGSGNDRFIIADGNLLPEVVILDFTKGADRIGVAVVPNLADAGVVVPDGVDTVVTLPNGRKVRLKSFTASNLAASDFVVTP